MKPKDKKHGAIEAIVYLKTGQQISTWFADDRVFNGHTLTSTVMHRLVGSDNSRLYFVQGDNIAYIEVVGLKPEEETIEANIEA